MIASKLLGTETDAARRAALQIAIQLPENINEARAVLDAAGTLLEGFLIRAPREPWQRRIAPALPDLSRRAWPATAALFGITAPAAIALGYFCGHIYTPAWIMAFGVIVATVLFSSWQGAAFAAASAVMLNFFLVDPALQFSAPTLREVVRLCAYLVIAFGLPLLSRRQAVSCGASVVRLSPD